MSRIRPTDAPESTERRFHALAANAFDLVSEIDGSGQVIYESPNHTAVLGRSLAERIAQPGIPLEVIHPEDREGVIERFARILADGESLRTTFRIAPFDAPRWMECTASPFEAEDGERHFVLVSRDVTDAKHTEERLRASRERFQLVSENAFDMIAEYDLTGRVLYANDRTRQVLGYANEDVRDQPPQWLVHPDDLEMVEAAYAGITDGATKSFEITYRVRRADGSWASLDTNAHAVRRSDGERRLVVIARDVSARVQAERRLRESEERYRDLVEDAPVGIVVVLDAKIAFANRVGARICGAEDPELLLSASIFDLLVPEDAGPIAERVARANRQPPSRDTLELRVRGLDGRVRDVLATGSGISFGGEPAFQVILRDVTEWREAERERGHLEHQLQEAQKLESLGVLAGGIAHDFNNLLAVILGNVRFAKGQLPNNADHAEALGDAIEAAESAARLTRQLLAYAGRRTPEVCALDLSAVVNATRELLGTATSRETTLEIELAENLPPVRADAVQLEQVLMNLVINAVDALGGEAGRVTVATGRRHASFEDIRSWIGGEGLVPGEYAYLEVRDTGRGMDDMTRNRVFEPFFTTKAHGHGLGLSAVLGLVRGHGGAIELGTELGGGTRMRVHLPPSGDAAVGETTAIATTRPPATATVLVIDPEEVTRRLALRVLGGRGCTVFEAASGPEALDLLARHGDEVDLALLDVRTPVPEGGHLARRLRVACGDLALLLTSAAEEPALVRELARAAPVGFLLKPFGEAELLAGLAGLLGKD